MKGFSVFTKKNRFHGSRVDSIPVQAGDIPFFEEKIEVDPVSGSQIKVLSYSYLMQCGCVVRSKEQLGGVCAYGCFVCRDHYDLCIGKMSPRLDLKYCCKRMRWKIWFKSCLYWLFFGEEERDEYKEDENESSAGS